ncbi:MAG: phenylalanyl-tRNA synthetase beta chain [Thermomicrobiales bacterium]|nr:phenylalanyl-tRNA synthetase beta chain [Thermomicrobiales bacterium]
MKVPMRWLSEFVDTGLTPKELAYRLTMAGLEAEKIEEIGAEWEKIYVGLVTKVEKHPNADRLSLAEVEAAEHRLTVVTGAPNIAQGQKVALALVGARLVDGHSDTGEVKVLKPAMMRGIKSEGMVCSEKELGLSEEHEGILELNPAAPLGVPLKDWLGDTVIEFEITPNLVHAFSIMGIAREAAALTNRPLRQPELADLDTLPTGPDDLVQIEAADLCPRYMGIVIEGIKVGPSPDWLVRRLTAAVMRPVNNVVDVTNYVMHEMGQPLHAFDRSRLREGRIVVRRAKPGETIETLDHQQRQLTPDMLVIADAERAVAMAGIMGGVDSEVSAETTTLLLEGANFEMKSVRHTARTLKLRTDASARFERGLDPNLVGPAMARATHLLLELSPGARVSAVSDVYPNPVQPHDLMMRFSRIEQVLGVRYEPVQVLEVLGRLGFAPRIAGENQNLQLTVTVPTYRHDVTIADDVVEEVARIVGYESLPSTLPLGRTAPVRRDPMYRLQKAVREALVASGASECVTYVTVSEEMLQPFTSDVGADAGLVRHAALGDLVSLRNPLQAERRLLRPTLIPSLLEVAAANLKHETGVRLFELARGYLPRGRDELPHEVDLCGIVLAGDRDPTGLYATPGSLDFFDLKGMLEAAWANAGVPTPTIAATTHPALHPGRAAMATIDGKTLAVFGELRPDVATSFGLDAPRVCVAEIDLSVALAALPERPSDVSVPRFLPVQQDFAVVVAEATPSGDVEAALRSGAGPLATGMALFDIYRGPQIGEGRKSLAFRVTFTAPDRALTDAELVKVRGRIEKVLKQRVEGTLRA